MSMLLVIPMKSAFDTMTSATMRLNVLPRMTLSRRCQKTASPQSRQSPSVSVTANVVRTIREPSGARWASTSISYALRRRFDVALFLVAKLLCSCPWRLFTLKVGRVCNMDALFGGFWKATPRDACGSSCDPVPALCKCDTDLSEDHDTTDCSEVRETPVEKLTEERCVFTGSACAVSGEARWPNMPSIGTPGTPVTVRTASSFSRSSTW
mmetsp:Transcript_38042/g.101388  ORF Transcript_38042/g.101388 Transcript_38042/m.101388 type:complete len:210 (+) Transcript_38042:1201-1830(+)